ncbi:hypothetical protein ACFPPE_18145 [Agromyces tardus]
MTSIDKGLQKITCISHGCELWLGRHLMPEEIRAIQKAHAIQHDTRAITPATILGDNNGDNK